jgi:serine/threonine protein kinase
LITSNAESFSASRGYMGLPEQALYAQDPFFAVEFDTSYDPSLGDINGNHVGIDVSTIISVASVDVFSRGIDLKSGRQITAWIEYGDDMKMIRVWVGYSHIRPPSPILVTQIDLANQFKEFMHIGFSASNGQGASIHVIDHWQFKTFGSLSSVIPTDTVEGGDCFICFSEEPSSSADDYARRKKVEEIAFGLGGLGAFVFSAFAILAVICFFLIKNRVNVGKRKGGLTCKVQTNRVPGRLSLAEIKSATMAFNPTRIVGEGASATVYKGSLPSGQEVAVKRFERANRNRMDCMRNPFTTEFATMVGCLRHKNLVQLQGWCCERNELVLVYEYLPKGSLNKVLHKHSNSEIVLSWKQRLNIVLGVASALTYLHEECERQIIHRDVKTCNIMLDAEFNAKLGDFGLAEVYEHSSVTRDATIPAGTMGYLAPEYVYSGVPTKKTDVYSFGVVVLEVATGRKPVDDGGKVVVDFVWDLWGKGKLLEAADRRLMGKFDVVEMERMLLVGLSCAHPDHEKRPPVKEAARMLRGEAPLPLLPARKPRVGIRPVLPEDSSAEDSQSPDDLPWMTPKSHLSKD